MLKPIHETHSIEAITLACEFSGEVDSAGLAVVREEGSRIKARLPFGRVMRRAGINPHDGTSSPPELRGLMFFNKIGEKETENFEIAKNRASFTSRAYSNFDSFFAQAKYVLELANQAFIKSGARLESIVLIYNDEFSSEDYDWEPSEGLKLGNPYMASICVKKGEFWHSATGYFDETKNPNHFILHNIDVSHSLQPKDDFEFDAPDQHILTVKLNHLYEFHKESQLSFSQTLLETVSELRDHHKIILSEIISDNLSARIGLTKVSKERPT